MNEKKTTRKKIKRTEPGKPQATMTIPEGQPQAREPDKVPPQGANASVSGGKAATQKDQVPADRGKVSVKKGKSPAKEPKATGRKELKAAWKSTAKGSKEATLAAKGPAAEAKKGSLLARREGVAAQARPVQRKRAVPVPQASKPALPNAEVAVKEIAAEVVPAILPRPTVAEATPIAKVVTLPPKITVRDLATLLNTSPINIIRELMKNGVMANINQEVDFDTAAIVAADMGFEAKEEHPPEPVEEQPVAPARKRHEYTAEEKARLVPRPPVVTIMGHVDHGKTSLLDVIRQSNVVASEVGGITQHIGAYQVEKQGKKITFLDTPGHEAFTAMRARGAMATDIAVLVVAADDGVQPQTLEAIAHARAAQVPIIVALNKIDKPTADPEGVKRQLADAGLVVEEYGGDTICVPVSAKQKIGLETLLEMILLVAEMADLGANPEAPASGTVIEGRMDKTKGPLATLLVQDGTLHVGDYLVIGTIAGKIRAMFDDKGQRIDSATPATPAVVLGLSDVPVAGESFQVVTDEHTARAQASAEATRRQEAAMQQKAKALSLDEFFAQAQAGQIKELNLILKADVQGSIEPIVNSVEKLGNESIHARFLHVGTGNIGESDVMLAKASNAIVLGFSVQVDAAASRLAEVEGVDIRRYDIIYRLVDDIDKALKGLLEPTYRDVTIGHATVRAVFSIAHRKRVAGCIVTDGIAARNASVRVKRGDNVLFEGQVASLRHLKEDMREVAAGMECGVGIEGFADFAEGDVLEFYRKEQVT